MSALSRISTDGQSAQTGHLGAELGLFRSLGQVAAATDAGAAVRSVSGRLILEFGLVLARADGWTRLVLVPGCGSREIGRCEGQDSAEDNGACVNCHAVDDSPGGG